GVCRAWSAACSACGFPVPLIREDTAAVPWAGTVDGRWTAAPHPSTAQPGAGCAGVDDGRRASSACPTGTRSREGPGTEERKEGLTLVLTTAPALLHAFHEALTRSAAWRTTEAGRAGRRGRTVAESVHPLPTGQTPHARGEHDHEAADAERDEIDHH